MIIYKTRYSDTGNRCMREAIYNDLHIDSISMEIFKNGVVKLSLSWIKLLRTVAHSCSLCDHCCKNLLDK